MSLELAIQANTAAIQQLIAVMSGQLVPVNVTVSVGPDDVDEEAEHQAIKEHLQEVRAASQPAEELQTIEPAKPLTYEADVLPVLHRFLVAKGKPAAESLLKKYGVDKFSKVPAEQLGDLLDDINKEMGAA